MSAASTSVTRGALDRLLPAARKSTIVQSRTAVRLTGEVDDSVLLLVNSTKSMDLGAAVPPRLRGTSPRFADEAARLVATLRRRPPEELPRLFGAAGALVDAARADLACWGAPDRPCRPALFVFTGLVYKGLAPAGFDAVMRRRAGRSLRILSGLYGLLRPFDLVEAYRLEMGSPLRPPGASTLVAFWRERVTEALNAELRDGEPVVTVAAREYMQAVDATALRGPLIAPDFKEEGPGGSLRTVTVHAKRARGALLRYALVSGARRPADLLGFDEEGWVAAGDPPPAGRWLFTRPSRG